MPLNSSLKLEEATFYGILDTTYATEQNWISKFKALVDGGAKIVQVRAKSKSFERRKSLFKAVYEIAQTFPKDTRPLLIVNDDIELCLEFPGSGLHLEENAPSLHLARDALGPKRVIGLAASSQDQAKTLLELASGTINYFSIGPVFASQTKPECKAVGLGRVDNIKFDPIS
ncbi:thiamine phosphate synthase [Puniceicoccaceae bacterium K14]|nr:thiamine phosphate synthase [Puniceicoccaceae bacterium K14]